MVYQDITKRIQGLLCAAASYYGMPFAPPRILIDLTGADAGQAIYEENLLRFNMDFCHYNHRHFIRNIVAHEIAHLIAPRVYGQHIAAHGSEWRVVMEQVFRVKPDSHHSYDLRQSGRYRFIYSCRCRGKETPLSATRYNREQRGVIYFCGECGGRLHFLYEETRYLRVSETKFPGNPRKFKYRRSSTADNWTEPLLHQRTLILPE